MRLRAVTAQKALHLEERSSTRFGAASSLFWIVQKLELFSWARSDGGWLGGFRTPCCTPSGLENYAYSQSCT